MTTSIKPIETKYDGYYFRSRLEARWAVVFHEMGISYEYEPEGFKLKNEGERVLYLPDFKLHSRSFGETWIEIKPPCSCTEDLIKPRLFAEQTNKRIIIVQGQPKPKHYTATLFSRFEHSDDEYDSEINIVEGAFGTCRKCNALCFIDEVNYEAVVQLIDDEDDCTNKDGEKWPLIPEPGEGHLLNCAFEKATMMRF